MRVGIRLDMPLYPVNVVVGLVDLPDCISTVLVQGLHRELRQQLAPGLTFGRSFLAVFLSGQDLSPLFIQRVLFFFELQLLPLQAPGYSNEFSLKAFLVEGSSGTMNSLSPRLPSSSDSGI